MDNNYNYNGYGNNEQNSGVNEVHYGNYSSAVNNGLNTGTGNEKPPVKKKKSGMFLFMLAAALLIGGSAGGGVYLGNRLAALNKEAAVQAETNDTEMKSIKTADDKDTEKKDEAKVSIAATGDNVTQVTAGSSDVSGVVENVMPSIVSINNVYEITGSDYWGRSIAGQQSGGSGSGIIIGQNKEEILMVTNNHVIAAENGAKNQKITVTFNDNTTADATVKGADSSSDLAVISVKMADLSKDTLSSIKIATLGDSNALKVGQMVIAIGNALGYGQSTTVGYVSALNREIASEDYTMKLIQTDAAINPGNSGGALLNAKGEVIGINSVKYSDTKVEGMGFSIPISTALPIISDLMNREEIAENEQSYLGIRGQDVTESHNKIYGMPVGVYIVEAVEGSPAARYGLKMGDIITGFNGTKITTMAELQNKLASVKAGTTVRLTVQEYNNGKYSEKTVEVTLGNKQEAQGGNSSANSNEEMPESGYKGGEGSFGNGGESNGMNPFNFFTNP